jgi:hypothetical protein
MSSARTGDPGPGEMTMLSKALSSYSKTCNSSNVISSFFSTTGATAFIHPTKIHVQVCHSPLVVGGLLISDIFRVNRTQLGNNGRHPHHTFFNYILWNSFTSSILASRHFNLAEAISLGNSSTTDTAVALTDTTT